MPRKGYRQSEDHIARRQESAQGTFMARGADQFFTFILGLGKEDRDEVVAERIAEAERVIAEAERLLSQRQHIRNSAGDPVERFRKALLRDIKALIAIRGETMRDAASVPYVSETQTRHAPMTGTHTHDHAAHDSTDHDDGIHHHLHEHHNDADHNHPVQHNFGTLQPGRASGSGEQVNRAGDGLYGRQMQAISPAERARLRNAQLAEHEQQYRH